MVHGIERRLDEYGPGTYFGEVPLLLGSPAIASLRAKEPSRVAQLDPDGLPRDVRRVQTCSRASSSTR